MNFQLSEEHLAVQSAARDFAENACKPGVIERDRDQIVAYDLLKQLGDLGFMGMMVDPKYGGSGMDTLSYVIAMEEISGQAFKNELNYISVNSFLNLSNIHNADITACWF